MSIILFNRKKNQEISELTNKLIQKEKKITELDRKIKELQQE